MRTMSSLIILLVMSACGAGEEEMPAAEETAVTPAPAVVGSAFHGTWEGQAMLEGTPDPIPVTMQGGSNGWTMTLPDRDPIPLTVSMSADSLVLASEPYESILQDGVTVRTRSAVVLQNGRMAGSLTATYAAPEGERVVSGTMEASRTGGM
ncbi:MAG: hypothetical protein LC667_03890 [Thioalkalivibrio sp.]|nr:hypothetical protein [Thioalkalivibrio sp.]